MFVVDFSGHQLIVNKPCSDAYSLARRPRVMLMSNKTMRSTAHHEALLQDQTYSCLIHVVYSVHMLWNIRSEECEIDNKFITAINFPSDSKDAQKHMADCWMILTRIHDQSTIHKTSRGCLGDKYLIQILVIFSSRKNNTVLTISASTWWIVPLENAPSTCKHQFQCNECFNLAKIVWNPSFLLLPEVIEYSIKNQPDIIDGLKSTYQRN